jgi:hypothetical protein
VGFTSPGQPALGPTTTRGIDAKTHVLIIHPTIVPVAIATIDRGLPVHASFLFILGIRHAAPPCNYLTEAGATPPNRVSLAPTRYNHPTRHQLDTRSIEIQAQVNLLASLDRG